MRRRNWILVFAWILGLPCAVTAQPFDKTAHGLELGKDAGHQAIAFDSADDSLVIGGNLAVRQGGCPPMSRGYLTRQSEGGLVLWQQELPDLFTQLTSLDPRHILSSTVHGVTVDPLTRDIFAVAEVLLAWQKPDGRWQDSSMGGSCGSGTESARGTLVLRLAADGTLSNDTYLGVRPEGPAPTRLDCRNLCSAAEHPRLSGHDIAVSADGGIVVTGLRDEGEASKQPAGDFVIRLFDDLATKAAGTTGGTSTTQAMCTPTGRVYSVEPLVGTRILGNSSPSMLDEGDLCKILMEPDGHGGEYGLLVEVNLPTPIPDPYPLRLQVQYLNNSPILWDVSVKRVVPPLTPEFDLIETVRSNNSGGVDTTVEIDNILNYVMPGNRIRIELKVNILTMDMNCNDDSAVDRIG